MADPFYVLGIPEDADDARVRSAYLEAVRRFPPERAPEIFQLVTEAHKAVQNEVVRARSRIFGSLKTDTFEDPRKLVPALPASRQRIGMERWLRTISSPGGTASERKMS